MPSSPPPQDEDNLARKKPRLGEPPATTTDEAVKETASPDISVGLPKRRYCRAVDCTRIVKSQGLCQSHGAKPRLCRVEWCGKQAQGNFNGMCKSHFKANKQGMTPLPPKPHHISALEPPPPAGEFVYDGILPASHAWNPVTSAGEMPLIEHFKQGFQAWHRNEERRARGLWPVENPAAQFEGWERELVWNGATRATGSWTPDEDVHLTSAVANTSKKRWGKEYTIDWVAVAALVPSRTKKQCQNRWKDVLDPSIDRANGRTGQWVEDEDSKLKDAVQMHGAKDWDAISTLISGRTRNQCSSRWRKALNPRIALAAGREGKWAEDEDSKLKNAVQTHGGKNWGAISALVPGRTRSQCRDRWRDTLDPIIGRANERTGKWAEDEDIKLKDAVKSHGGKNWDQIAALVPGRTKKQCRCRWNYALNPSVTLTAGRDYNWTAIENSKLKDAVLTHGDKNWKEVAALVPGRTNKQCSDRWRKQMDPNRSTVRRTEHGMLKNALVLGQDSHCT
jgi:hypothetical protein